MGLFVTAGLTLWAARAAGAAAASAAKSAGIADSTLKQMERSSERELRAYLGIAITGTNFSRGTNNAVLCEARYAITNYGQTPAYDVSVDTDFRIAPAPLTEDLASLARNAIEYKAVAQPGHAVAGKAVKGVSGVGVGAGKLYLLVVVRYRDAFEKQRETRFCGYFPDTSAIFSPAPSFGPGTIPFAFTQSDRHNSAT